MGNNCSRGVIEVNKTLKTMEAVKENGKKAYNKKYLIYLKEIKKMMELYVRLCNEMPNKHVNAPTS